jgi:hypothetical protein
MPRFRPRRPDSDERPVTADAVTELAGRLLAPAHFYAAPGLGLTWEPSKAEVISWEIFRGRLLDPAHTRQRRGFVSWNIYRTGPEGRSAEPVLSLKWDAEASELHVVRSLECHVWEGYDAGGNVILSREQRKWVRELVGTVSTDRLVARDELEDELACLLFLAVVGTSRLPLSSLEAPLPAFSFGELFYSYRPTAHPDDGAAMTWEELPVRMMQPASTWREHARLLEAYLRAAPAAAMSAVAGLWVRQWNRLDGSPAGLAALLRTVFNEVSLSPWTDFVDRVLAFVQELEAAAYFDAATAVDFLSYLLRQAGRHLTAYDLVTFHHRGANYPDALLLDAVLKAYLAASERRPDLFAPQGDDTEAQSTRRLRRRALRQAFLLRRRYEEHPVPDLPTSPGENSRVLPPSHPRVPEEQILQLTRRTRRLYAGDPLPRHLGPHAAALLRAGFDDLTHPDERRELGLGLFIDRPLAAGKHPAEPDQTLLLSSLAYSRSVAAERLRALAGEVGLAPAAAEVEEVRRRLDLPGLPPDAIGEASRPGSVTLADARRAAPDFAFLWTTAGSVRDLLAQFDFGALSGRFDVRYLLEGPRLLIARSPEGPGIRVHDERLRPRLELEVPSGEGFVRRAGQEYPAGGLLAVRVWQEGATEWESIDLRADPVRIPARDG